LSRSIAATFSSNRVGDLGGAVLEAPIEELFLCWGSGCRSSASRTAASAAMASMLARE